MHISNSEHAGNNHKLVQPCTCSCCHPVGMPEGFHNSHSHHTLRCGDVQEHLHKVLRRSNLPAKSWWGTMALVHSCSTTMSIALGLPSTAARSEASQRQCHAAAPQRHTPPAPAWSQVSVHGTLSRRGYMAGCSRSPLQQSEQLLGKMPAALKHF